MSKIDIHSVSQRAFGLTVYHGTTLQTGEN